MGKEEKKESREIRYMLELNTKAIRDKLSANAYGGVGEIRSVKGLAAKMGIDRHTLANYLNNPRSVSLETVSKIANVLFPNEPYPENLIKRIEK